MELLRRYPTPALLLVTVTACLLNFPDFLHGGKPPVFCLPLSLLYLAGWGWYAAVFGGEKRRGRLVLVWGGFILFFLLFPPCARPVVDLIMKHLEWLCIPLLFLGILLFSPLYGLSLLVPSYTAVERFMGLYALTLILLCLWKRQKRNRA